VYSGIQPTGDLHIGNYFGAVQQWLRVQHQAAIHTLKQAMRSEDSLERTAATRNPSMAPQDGTEVVVPMFSMADLHALTTTPEPDVLDKSVHNLAAMLLACGINPRISMLFQQSLVRCVPQLHCSVSERASERACKCGCDGGCV
jgi:tryptophanyl-tRNA synthetase